VPPGFRLKLDLVSFTDFFEVISHRFDPTPRLSGDFPSGHPLLLIEYVNVFVEQFVVSFLGFD
jgi:hypothetical protein